MDKFDFQRVEEYIENRASTHGISNGLRHAKKRACIFAWDCPLVVVRKLFLLLCMTQGWIKLHRQILENAMARKPMYAWLWTTLLLMANHEDNEFIWNGEKQVCKAGQVLTGRDALSFQTGIPPTSIERILDYLENEHQIGQQKTAKFRLITIIKWNEYQISDTKADNRRTTDGQQTDTNKKDKNVKNEKNNTGDDEILKELKRHEEIGNPVAYLSALRRKAKPLAIKKAWGEWKRGNGVNSPAEFYNRCLHYSQ